MIKTLASVFLPTILEFVVYILKRSDEYGFEPVKECRGMGANFGVQLTGALEKDGCGLAVRPADACFNPLTLPYNQSIERCYRNIAVVARGNCSFAQKAYNIQQYSAEMFDAILIYNDPNEEPVGMKGDEKYGPLVTRIPVVMITWECAKAILQTFPFPKGYMVLIRQPPSYYSVFKYLLPFIAIVAFCFLVLLVASVVKLIRERRYVARRRLSGRQLKQIPSKKFTKGDPYETCPICLDDFEEGDKIRILPCNHAYHCKCVDPWLTKNRKVCPVCKRKVTQGDGTDTDDSEDDTVIRRADAAGPSSVASAAVLPETTPLVTTPPGSARASPARNSPSGSTIGIINPNYQSTSNDIGGGSPHGSLNGSVTPPDELTIAYKEGYRAGKRAGRGRRTAPNAHAHVSSTTDLSSGPEQPIIGIVMGPRASNPADAGASTDATLDDNVNDEGTSNHGYVADESDLAPTTTDDVRVHKAPPPRKRHPAATKERKPKMVDTRLELDSNDDGEEQEDAEAETIVQFPKSTGPPSTSRGPPPPHRRSKRKKEKSREKPISPPEMDEHSLAVSAPAHLPPADGDRPDSADAAAAMALDRLDSRDEHFLATAGGNMDELTTATADDDDKQKLIV